MAALMEAANPLPRWQRRGLYTSTAALTASGLVWWVVHYTWGAGTGELPHPAELWMVRVHGAAAMAGLFFVGVLGSVHVPRGWRVARQRVTGVSLLAGLGLLALSGYALYYFAPETLRPWIGNGHTVAGITVAALLVWHSGIVQRR